MGNKKRATRDMKMKEEKPEKEDEGCGGAGRGFLHDAFRRGSFLKEAPSPSSRSSV